MDPTVIALTAIISSACSGIVGAIVASLIAYTKGFNKKEKAFRDGMRLLLCDKVKYLTNQAIKEGEITIEQKSFIHSMIDTAHDLGANGEMTSCGVEIDKLPISK